MAELATAIGYSRVTVSKALNGHTDVPEATRELILQRALELGYRPHTAARSIGKGSTDMLSLVVTTQSSTSISYTGLLRGIQRGLEPRDLLLTANEYPIDVADDENFSPRLFRELVSDGILLDTLRELPGFAKAAERVRIPFVYLNHRRDVDAVFPDDHAGAEQATAELIRLGHRRIAWVGNHDGTHYSVSERTAGFTAAMTAAGLKPTCYEVPIWNHSNAELLSAIEAILTSDERPTAILAYHARAAGTALFVAARLGLRVPEDLSILSFHGELITQQGLSIATQRIPFDECGTQAVDLLLAKIAANGATQQAVRVPYGATVRGDSLGPPPAP